MPEGDTLFRSARSLRDALLHQTVVAFRSPLPRVANEAERLQVVGSEVAMVDARGKHLLIAFSVGALLRTHLQMTGSWHVYRPGSPWQKPAHRAGVVLETERAIAVCFSAPTVELVPCHPSGEVPALGHLGPDILSDTFDLADAVRRLRQRSDVEIAVALLDQTALAGIGNVYKSEVLFLCGVDPFALVGDLAEEVLSHLIETAYQQMRRNLLSDMRRTTAVDAPHRLWVYGHTNDPCQRCGRPIRGRRQGLQARFTYWCPGCQPAAVIVESDLDQYG